MSFTGSTFSRFTRTYLIIFGGLFVVIGIGMIVVLGGIPYAGETIWLTGGIFAIVGGALVVVGLVIGRGASATDQILASGVTGTATITGVTQTGMYLNDQPRIKMDLLVALPGRAPYTAEHAEFVPLILLARVQPGATLPVKVDPANPQKVVVDWQGSAGASLPGSPLAGATLAPPPSPTGPGSTVDESLSQVQAALAGSGAAVAAPFASPDQAGYTIEQLRAWLRANGVEAQARVDFLQDTGKIVGDERLYTMEMTLMVPGSAPEKLPRSAAMVPLAVMSRLTQGMVLPVKVAADNHDLLTIEWEKV
jgi:hypothetical protein